MSLPIITGVFTMSLLMGLSMQTKWNIRNYSLYCILGIMLIVAATFRPAYMPDYESYVMALLRNTSGRMEPSFYIIKHFWKNLGLNPLGTFFTYAFIGTILIMYCIKRDSRYYWFSLCLFTSLYFILGEMIQIRQAVATGFMLLSIKYLFLKNYKIYFFLTLCAIIFHFSAVIMIPLYFLSSKSKHRCIYLISIVVCLFLGGIVQFDNIVKFINIQYLSNIYYAKTAMIDIYEPKPIYYNIRFLLQIIVCIFFWIKADSLIDKLPYLLIYLKIYTIGICIYLLLYSIPDFADRLSTMLLISEIILLPWAIELLRNKMIVVVIITVISFKYFAYSMSTYLLN